jgi:drug/metabolite transporter (DMT)-like permease
MPSQSLGHLAASFTILLWGATFISTKVLLETFSPVEILVVRFVLGYVALWAAAPRFLRLRERREELYFAAAGVTGITLYYLLENIALVYASASNVGITVSTAPFFTALLVPVFMKGKTAIPFRFYVGFFVALSGIALITVQESALSFSPFGDFLALLAALAWAVYSHLLRIVFSFSYPTILVTRRIFGYGILCMLPILFWEDCVFPLAAIFDPLNLGNLLFLGLGASACCFATWNYAVKVMGPVKTGVYIYATPVVTAGLAILILQEPFTWLSACGMALALAGLWLSKDAG